jgi:hypothetical protein
VEPAELEVPEFLAFGDVVTGVDVWVDDAGRHIRHADRHKGHQADDGIVGLDDDDRSCRRVRHVGLRVRWLDRVAAFGICLGEVCALLDEGPHDRARDRAAHAQLGQRWDLDRWDGRHKAGPSQRDLCAPLRGVDLHVIGEQTHQGDAAAAQGVLHWRGA